MITTSESINELSKDFVELQNSIKNPTRDTTAYKYKYAQLDQIINDIKPKCAEHGFSLIQMPYNEESFVGVETMLLHRSGEWLKGRFGTKPIDQDAQTIGSLTSYYRRYSVLALFNLAQEDDDGKAATKQKQTTTNHSASSGSISDKQKKYIASLVTNAGFIIDESTRPAMSKLTQQTADKLIKKLANKELRDQNEFANFVFKL